MKKITVSPKIFIYVSALVILLLFKTQSQQMPDYTGQVFPQNHALNTPIDLLSVHPNSNNYISSIGANTTIHPDFGTDYNGSPMGIPYNMVGSGQTLVPFTFEYESDPGPYPIPIPPFIEGLYSYTADTDGDRHILVVDTNAHKLYETWYTWPPGHSMPDPQDWSTYPPSNPSYWWAGSGSIFDLTSNTLRPDGWTSADAAGLPIFPLLIRYDEVERAMTTDSIIHHAIRFTVQHSQNTYVWPARHYASSSADTNRPPMGLRFRLKDTVNISQYSFRMRVILRTMKKYGIIVADNGSNWFFQGTHDDRWDDNELNSLKDFHGNDFEAVDISPWLHRAGFDINSATVPPATSTYVPSSSSKLPSVIYLYQNYPNPFNPTTTITFTLAQDGMTTLKVFDMLGREVATLADEELKAGVVHQATFDASKLSSGIYFYRLKAGKNSLIKKLVLMK